MSKREELIKKRKKLGYLQDDVAKEAGISRVAYCNIELGKRNPSVKVAKRIGKLLEMDWTELFNEIV